MTEPSPTSARPPAPTDAERREAALAAAGFRPGTWVALGRHRGTTAVVERGAADRAHAAHDSSNRPHPSPSPDEPIPLAVKLPLSEADRRRTALEGALLAWAADRLAIPAPRRLGANGDDLVLEDVGDAAPAGTVVPTGDLVGLATALGRMHRATRGIADGAPGDQPVGLLGWGHGTRGATAPHARRVRRARRRVPGFAARLDASTRPTAAARLPALLDAMPAILARQSDRPTTLVHGDVHAANVVWRPADPARPVILLDWQQASSGPPEVDVARLLVEMTEDAAEASAVLAAWRAAYGERHTDEVGHDAGTESAIDDAACLVLTGLVAAYGGRDAADIAARPIAAWEAAIIRRAWSAEGFGVAACERVLRRTERPSGDLGS